MMLDGNALLNQRFKDVRPGLALIAIEDGALPVTVLSATVVAQERKPLPLLDEFLVRLTDAGLGTVEDVASFLGLDRTLVDDALADQINSGNLSYRPEGQRVALTLQGKRTAQDLEAVQPVQKSIPLSFDRLTWSIAPYQENQLLQKREVQDAGLVLVPAKKTAHITIEDVTAPAINGLLRAANSQDPKIEVLSVKKVKATKPRYLPVKLLVFGDVDRGEVQVAFCIDGDLSDQHEFALNELGGPQALGISVAAPAARPALSADLESVRLGGDGVAALQEESMAAELARAGWPVDQAEPQAGPVLDTAARLEAIPVRGVAMLEHPELLNQALDEAKTRLLIISPWVRNAVVGTNFIARLERRIRAGVRVHIAHGFGDDDSGSDNQALERLSNLQRRFPEKFTFARLANTHAKILIFDDKWISTSFNWLSFRGDPQRTYRMEEGTLVQLPDHVAAEYKRYVEVIEAQRID